MCQVAFDSHLYFQRYASDKLVIANIGKGNNSINTGDRVIVLALCTFSHYRLSVYIKFHFFIFNTFTEMLQTNLLLRKLERGITVITCDRVMVLALCTSSDDIFKFYLIPFFTFRDILRTN